MKTFFVQTYGCQMNKSDSERIIGILKRFGFKLCQKENQADLIVLNTCTVRQSAEDRFFGKLLQLQKLREKNPNLRIAVTGCIASKDPEKLKGKADLAFNIENLPYLPDLLKQQKMEDKQYKANNEEGRDGYFDIRPDYQNRSCAYIPIMTGCNNFCSYCVVPYARGRERSRLAQKIISEIKGLIRKNYKAVTLIGQNVNSYKNPDTSLNFSGLLRMADQIPGNFWIWFMTSHPKDMSKELIDTIASSKKICHYIHLPVQAGDNEILRLMNRNYTREHYINLVKMIRKKIPDVSISTDVIVGFPEETKKQFEQTRDLFKEIKFDMAYIAQYSPRPKTKAFELEDSVSNEEKKEREKELTEILKQTAKEKNQKLVGKTVKVLIEKACTKNLFLGKTQGFKTVKFKGENIFEGQVADVKIKKVSSWGLNGEIS